MPETAERVPQKKRRALGDAGNRANYSPARVTGQKTAVIDESRKDARDLQNPMFEEYLRIIGVTGATRDRAIAYAVSKEKNAHGSVAQSTAASGVGVTRRGNEKKTALAGASSSKKRKAEMSLEEEIAAYKQNLDHIISRDAFEDDRLPSCNAVRARINKLLDAGIMNRTEFSQAIGMRSTTNLSNFLKQTGPYGGSGSAVYYSAWAWFKQREFAKLKMPDVKKRQAEERDAAASSAGASAKSEPTLKTAAATSLPDTSNIYLKGEETDSVSVWDTCDEVRRKINAHLKTPGLTQAQFCRDLFAQLNEPKIKDIRQKQLADFRAQKGPRTGAKSTVFYAAYVYFEKLRIALGKPKTIHREEMEHIWAWKGGFDRENDHRTSFIVAAGCHHFVDQYGRIVNASMLDRT
ncbi:hypothetical protein AAE478_004143 [Parahypoxylon ruwenzoriense]